MSRLLAIGLFFIGAGLVSGDLIEFENEQRLTGELAESAADRLLLKHSAGAEPLELSRDQIRRIEFETPEDLDGHEAELLCLDGTRLSGEVRSYADGVLKFGSSSLGDLEIRADQIASLIFTGGNVGTAFRMTGEADQWNLNSSKAWRFDQAKRSMTNLESSSSAGFLAELPVHFKLSFEVKWQKVPKLEIFIGGNDLSYGSSASRYKFVLNRSGFQLARTLGNERGSKNLNNSEKDVFEPSFTDEGSAIFTIEIDRRNKLIKVMIDGKLAGKFYDFENGVVEGNAVFLKTGTEGQELSDLILSKNSGVLTIDREEALVEDQLVSIDGDRVAGELRLIEDEEGRNMLFMIKQGGQERPLEVPKSRIAMIHFKGAAMAEDRSASFALSNKGEKIYGNIGMIGPDFIEVKNKIMGKVLLKRDAAKSLDFQTKEVAE